ncbi:MAG: type IV secretory system conjugative DNA transfer family protein [Acidimicrobiales bacterium]
MSLFSRIRPRHDMAEHGILLGQSVEHGVPFFATFEDSILVLGPPRSGKSSSLIIPTLCDAPGAVVTTSTRPDVLAATAKLRAKAGPVSVFDPQGLAAHLGVPTLRWDPVAGCEDPEVAIRRTSAFVAGIDLGQAGGGQFWTAAAAALIRCLLHAAAISGGGIADVAAWVKAPADTTPVRILGRPDAAPGWGDELAAIVHQPPATSGSVFATAQRAFDCFALPSVLASCQPSGDGFDPREFVRRGGTLYVLGTPSSANSVAPLLACLVQEIVEEARIAAAAMPGGRLEPPLELLLDEAANIAPLPSLPQLMATGGGDGICLMLVLQSQAQAVHRWSQAQADALRDAATIRLALPGINDATTLRDLSQLCGEVEIAQESTSRGGGGKSTSTHVQRVPRFSPDAIRSLPDGHALLLHRRLPPFEIKLSPWWDRRFAGEIKDSLSS